MTIKNLLAIALVSLALPLVADAQFREITRTYELELSNFQAPATQHGVAVFRQCGDCDRLRVRATANTQYRINGQPVRFDDFRQALAEFNGDRDDVYVGLKRHLESDTVVYIDVHL